MVRLEASPVLTINASVSCCLILEVKVGTKHCLHARQSMVPQGMGHMYVEKRQYELRPGSMC